MDERERVQARRRRGILVNEVSGLRWTAAGLGLAAHAVQQQQQLAARPPRPCTVY
jgi:hypothetical protein